MSLHRRADIACLMHLYICIITGLAGRENKKNILACESGIYSRHGSVYERIHKFITIGNGLR
jgi:hypothetical protein